MIGGKLYVYSGCDANGNAAKRLDRYDPATDSWTTLTSALFTHFYPPVAGVINGKLYLAGLSTSGLGATLEVYDPATNGWTLRRPMPTARHRVTGAVISGKLYVVGGRATNNIVQPTVEAYTPGTDSWATLSPMLLPAELSGAAVIKSVLYVVGGFTGTVPLPTNRAYTR